MTPAEIAQVVRLLERQGFRVEVMTTLPLRLLVTIPPTIR